MGTTIGVQPCAHLTEPVAESFGRNADPDPDRKLVFGFASGWLAAEGDRLARSAKLCGSHEAARR
jgi:hypothetical protein